MRSGRLPRRAPMIKLIAAANTSDTALSCAEGERGGVSLPWKLNKSRTEIRGIIFHLSRSRRTYSMDQRCQPFPLASETLVRGQPTKRGNSVYARRVRVTKYRGKTGKDRNDRGSWWRNRCHATASDLMISFWNRRPFCETLVMIPQKRRSGYAKRLSWVVLGVF